MYDQTVPIEEHVVETVLPSVEEPSLLTDKPSFQSSINRIMNIEIVLPQDMELSDRKIELLAPDHETDSGNREKQKIHSAALYINAISNGCETDLT